MPCTSHSTCPCCCAMRCASSSKTAMNSLPMILRLRSGSVTPASFARNRSVASTASRFRPSLSRRLCCTFSNSFLRSTPLLTKTQVRRSPMARCTSVAATEESTPPESAQMARPSPTVRRTEATVSSMKCWFVHSGRAWQMPKMKFFRMSVPWRVWWTSGWNWTAYRLRLGSSMAATAAFCVRATSLKPGGSSSASSPCDIQTDISAGNS